MILTLDLKNYHGKSLTTVATGEDGKRYFKERNGLWKSDGARASEWETLYSLFRRSDWASRRGEHVSGCPANQYLSASCNTECENLTRMLWRYGGPPASWKEEPPSRDERNEYRSSVESYG